MRRTKRRTRYTWLPTIGSLAQAESDTDIVSGRSFSVGVSTNGETTVVITDLTNDEPLEGEQIQAASPLGTILGNEYFLKRIVGKCFAAFRPQLNEDGDPSFVRAALFGAGFFIARANDASQGADAPIGSQTLSERQENYNPLGNDCIREPWIWRRTWILSNPGEFALRDALFRAGVNTSGFGFDTAPSTTMGYGSVADGPHIDAKTARRIKQDERLWFAIATVSMPLQSVHNEIGTIDGYLDYRLLGALRKARQGSSF